MLQLNKHIITCLPLRETYTLFPPCMFVRASIRASVHLFVTLSLSEPYLQEPSVQKIVKHLKITYILKLCNKKLKFNFAKKWESFGQETTFWFVFCPGKISVTIKDRDTGIF